MKLCYNDFVNVYGYRLKLSSAEILFTIATDCSPATATPMKVLMSRFPLLLLCAKRKRNTGRNKSDYGGPEKNH